METAGSRRRGQRGGRRSPPCPKAPCPARRDQGTRLLRAQRDEGQVTTSEGQRVPGGTARIWRNVCLGGDTLGDRRHPEGQEEPAGTAHLGTAGAVRRSTARGAAGVQRDSLCFGDSVCLREQGSGETARASRDSTWLGDSRRSGDGTCLGTACGRGTASPPCPSRAPTVTAGQVTCPWHPK